MQKPKMNERIFVLISLVAWAVGLVAFFLSFFEISVFGLGMSFSGFTLLFRIGELGKEMPVNIPLWIAFLTGVAGLVLSVLCVRDWEKEKATPKPLIAAVCGVVGLLCLFFFMSAYGADVKEVKAFLKLGAGRVLAILAYLVAACAILAPRYLLPWLHKGQTPADGGPQDPQI